MQLTESIPAIGKGKLPVGTPSIKIDPAQSDDRHHIHGVLGANRKIIDKREVGRLIAILNPGPSRTNRGVVEDMKPARIVIQFVGSFGRIVNHIPEGIDRSAPDRLETNSHTDIPKTVAKRTDIPFAIVQFESVIAAP